MQLEKPFAPACDRNQEVIIQVLLKHLRNTDQSILEIGSGTGQHAVYFGHQLSNRIWQTSDVLENHAGIKMWLDEVNLKNVKYPIEYEIGQNDWPSFKADIVFSANTLHIISFELVKRFISDLGRNLEGGNRVYFYGPFKYQGQFTSASNADFENWLKDIDPLRGIRDFEVINSLMQEQQFALIKDITMPANNQILIFEKT